MVNDENSVASDNGGTVDIHNEVAEEAVEPRKVFKLIERKPKARMEIPTADA